MPRKPARTARPKKKRPGVAPSLKGPPVESIRHKDKRVNIPTEELRDFVADDEKAPKTILYPRDPSLDPQLVWKGKDEQDAKPLEVPVVPIYIQEKIHPHALVDDLRRHAAKLPAAAAAEQQLDLFGDFNGIEDFEKKVDFYHHEGRWTNRMILGDSLLVMTSLAEKEGLKGRVQTIYFDPPYGIKFGSNWQVSTRKRDVKDGKVDDATRQPEQVRAFRDTWELGIHSYLAYLRDRLVAARNLIDETGSVFVQIGDENIHLVRCVLDEIFGSENFISIITVRKTGGTTGDFLPATADFVLWYARDRGRTKYREAFRLRGSDGPDSSSYDLVELQDGRRRRMTPDERQDGRAPGRRLQLTILTSPRVRAARTGYFPIVFEGREYFPTAGEWKTNREGIQRLMGARRIDRVGETLRYVRYLDDFPATVLTNTWVDLGGAADPVYVVQTNARIVERCILMTSDPGDLVLDPTCGGGTTAIVAEQWGRRWITLDTSRVALALARTRLMAAKYPYYLLADSPEGRQKEAGLTGQAPPEQRPDGDIRQGFVYERVPHVTLKSIANNPDIREGMSREEIDEAIARHAETEILYDRPYEDGKRVRVTGPFTVESLSPHRVLPTDEERPASEIDGRRDPSAGQFETMVIENLRKAGVQNTRKEERLVFEHLDPFPGRWLHAAGVFTDTNGRERRVAVSLGPEHGTVGAEQVKEAAKEALHGQGFDLLVVCGFAFDAAAGEATGQFSPDGPAKKPTGFAIAEGRKQLGKLPVLLARMNPDLLMGDELLKKTGNANLFMVFGEPDVDIDKSKDGQLRVKLKGVDVYDPTTGEIRTSSTDDVACWFIDTDYNGESFFVRHAYFTGATEPYEKLKRALRADIDEGAWSALYSTESRPFPAPKSGKIAIKVINHYGDEVLRVMSIEGLRA